jgi:hypothetical protein
MNYTTAVGKPNAHITKKKSRLKIYNGHVVFMEDQDNFEFEIHNPTRKTVLCKIKLNGDYISQSGLVLRPGERIFLERFLDTNNKFQFSTYSVTNTTENQSAIVLNGDVRVEFYDEKFPPTNNLNYSSTGSFQPWHSTLIGTNINHTGGYLSPQTFTTNTASLIGGSNACYTNTSSLSLSKNIDTGRVEKGEKSNQNFQNSYEEFNSYTSHQISYKIQPLSTKNKTSKDIRQYCTECGVKTKPNFKFCPSCGNDLTKPKETKIKYTNETIIMVNNRNYVMETYKITLDKLIEQNQGKTIVIHKPSLSEEFIRAILY